MNRSWPLVMLLALPAAGADTKALPAGPSLLPALLVGDLFAPLNPVRARLELHAEGLAASAQGGGVSPALAEAYLAPLTRPGAEPVDRLSAGVLSRVIVSRGEHAALMESQPVLKRGPLADLHQLLMPDDPYRGSFAQSAPLAALAQASQLDPAVAAVFEGRRAAPLLLEDVAADGENLRFLGKKLKDMKEGQPGAPFAHPLVPGVALKLMTASSVGNDTWTTQRLGDAGIGPRLLAWTPMRSARGVSAGVGVKELVTGESLWELIANARYGREDHERVLALLDRLAAESLEPEHLEKFNIFLGRTLADPARKAYILDAVGFRAHGTTDRDELRARLLQRDIFDKMDVAHGGDNAMVSPLYRPLGEILREGVYWGTRPGLWERFTGLFRRGKKPGP